MADVRVGQEHSVVTINPNKAIIVANVNSWDIKSAFEVPTNLLRMIESCTWDKPFFVVRVAVESSSPSRHVKVLFDCSLLVDRLRTRFQPKFQLFWHVG